MTYQIAFGTRIRRSPYFDATVADGVSHFSVYNRMYMPTAYGDPMAEYWRIIEGVSMWDVAVERQVEVSGPDAARLVQALAPRRIDRMQVGQGRYVAVCDHRGVLINDPVLLKLAEDRFWFSIADSDLVLWARAIAAERGLNVTVCEPDVAPLAIQGPKGMDVAADLVGDWVRELKHFAFRDARIDDIDVIVARSGWSKQGGVELYLQDPARGVDLWNRVREAGQPYGIGPGAPNQMERIESGLLSYGADTDDETNPFEVRMDRFVNTDAPDDVIGIEALRRLARTGPARHQLGIVLEDSARIADPTRWYQILKGGALLGHLTSVAWSPRLSATIGLCLVDRSLAPGDAVQVAGPDGPLAGEMRTLPFL